MSSDSRPAPATPNCKWDRLKRLLRLTVPCLSDRALLKSPVTDSTPVPGASTHNILPSRPHYVFRRRQGHAVKIPIGGRHSNTDII